MSGRSENRVAPSLRSEGRSDRIAVHISGCEEAIGVNDQEIGKSVEYIDAKVDERAENADPAIRVQRDHGGRLRGNQGRTTMKRQDRDEIKRAGS